MGRVGESGATLIEMLLTLGLFLTVLLGVGSLIQKSSQTLRFSEKKASSTRDLTIGLELMARQVRGAQEITSPLTGQRADRLNFRTVDPANQERLYPDSSPPNFPILNLNRGEALLQISFERSADELKRTLINSAGETREIRLSKGLKSLEFSRGDEALLQVSLVKIEEKRDKTVSYSIYLHGAPQ